MEINSLIFPAPKSTYKETDLKELMQIPVYPQLFDRQIQNMQEPSQKNNLQQSNKIFKHSSQTHLRNYSKDIFQQIQERDQKKSQPKVVIIISRDYKIQFQKQNPFSPPDQEPVNDLSRTIYDEEIDEDINKDYQKYSSPKHVNVYSSSNFTQSNCFMKSIDLSNYNSVASNKPPTEIENYSIMPETQKKAQIKDLKQGNLSKNNIHFDGRYKNGQQYNYFNRKLRDDGSESEVQEQFGDNKNSQSKVTYNSQPLLNENQSLNSLNKSLKKSTAELRQSQQKQKGIKFIPCLYLQAYPKTKYIALFFHGNGEDLNSSYSLIDHLRKILKVNLTKKLNIYYQINVLAVEYPGYGIYSGTASEETILGDANYIYQYLTKHSDIPEQKMIIIGRSIGSGQLYDRKQNINRPATYLASRFNPGMLTLISPFLSIREAVKFSFGTLLSQFVKERFENKENIKKVNCPTFILHGQKDNIIPWKHSVELNNLCGGPCQLLTPKMMDHFRFQFYDDLTNPLKQFMQQNGINIQIQNSLHKKSNSRTNNVIGRGVSSQATLKMFQSC